MSPNAGKKLECTIDGTTYERHPIRTHVLRDHDRLVDVIDQYVIPLWEKEDVLFISERIVAIMQGRAYPIQDIHPSWLARVLVCFVYRSPYGIGLGSPWTMELALREAGRLRVLLAAIASAFTKPFGMRGLFYRLVGHDIRAIDGPCSYTLPPYNTYAKLPPKNPHRVVQSLEDQYQIPSVIIDANDLGVEVLGASARAPTPLLCQRLFADNPLGQTTECTPLCLVRIRK